MHIGQNREDRSHARIDVSADSAEKLTELIARLARHGAIVRTADDARLVPAEMDGAFPEAFYSTTNMQTFVRHDGKWHEWPFRRWTAACDSTAGASSACR